MEELGGYRLIEQLGSGGMGVVYLGIDGAGNPVAVKVLHAHIANDEIARQRLAREVRTLRRIKHPRIAEVLDAELDSPTPFLVTEFVDGMTLSEDVRENGPFAEDELVHFGHALLDALNAVHEAGVIHRDLKPANVMIMDGEPMVIDFGIAQAADEVRVTATGLVMGTPGYLSPEIADGKPSNEKTDWWGWAATMAFAATGRNPYGSGPLEAVLGRVAMGRSNLDGAPALFVPLLRACLDPKPERRPSGQMILEALVDIESGRMPTLGQSRQDRAPIPEAPGYSGPGTAVMPQGVPRHQGAHGPGHPGAGAAAGLAAAGYPGADRTPAQGSPMPGTPAVGAAPQNPGAAAVGMSAPAHVHGVSGTPTPAQLPGRARPAYGPLGLDPRATPQGASGAVAGPYPGAPVQAHVQGGHPAPQGQPGPTVAPAHAPRKRVGIWAVLALLVVGVTVTPLGPFLVLFSSYVWGIVARTIASLARHRHRTRIEYGPGAVSTAGTVGRLPFVLLGETVLSAISHVLPGIAALAVAVLMRLDVMGIVPSGMSEAVSMWAAGATAAVVLWLGPGSGKLRMGSRYLMHSVSRNHVGEWIVVGVLTVVAAFAIIAVTSGASTTWWPLAENPFAMIPTAGS